MKYIETQIMGKGRRFTYECDDDAVNVGDTVEFTLPSGVTTTGEVLSVTDNAPPFPCKPAMKIG